MLSQVMKTALICSVIIGLPVAGICDDVKPQGSRWVSPKRFENPPSHPRLFVTAEQIERMVRGRGDAYSAVYESVESAAEAAVRDSDNPLAGESVWRRAIRMQDRVMSLLVQWHRTKDRRYIDAVMRDLKVIRGWMSDGDVTLAEGQFSTVLAIAYDLLYNDLTGKERAELVAIAREDFITPFLKVTAPGDPDNRISGERRSWWQDIISNWNPVSISGGGLLALAMYEDLDEAQTVIDRVNESYQPIFDYLQSTNGGWVEGLGYWNWSIHYMSLFLISYERVSGEKHEGFRSGGFRDSLIFGTYFVPNGEPCGFGDNQHGHFGDSLLAAAEHLKDSDALLRLKDYWRNIERANRIRQKIRADEGSKEGAGGQSRLVRKGAYHLLLDPDGEYDPIQPEKNVVKTFPRQGWSMIADQWPDSKIYAAVRGGTLGGAHTHQDLLSWHAVIGVEKMIHSIHESGYYTTAWQSRAHEIYERSSDAKNTLFIGGLSAYTGQPRQRGGQFASAKETSFLLPTGPVLRLDATRAFWLTRNDPRLVCRVFAVIEDKGLLVLDRVIGRGNNPVEARVYTTKNAVFGKTDVLLKGSFETARLTFAADQSSVLRRSSALLTEGRGEPPVMMRWQTLHSVRDVTMAALLTRGDKPVDLSVGVEGGEVVVKIKGAGLDRILRFTSQLEMPVSE